MCGLTGFLRHPDSTLPLSTALSVFDDLMLAMEQRGHHASGVALFDAAGENTALVKRAVSYSVARKARDFRVLDTLTDTSMAVGHTRFATHANAEIDECAHPFKFGKVVGAHNGVIRNWTDLRKHSPTGNRWRVDSEAAFALINEAGDPATALKRLGGYFALTWSTGKVLSMVRTADASLAIAYLGGDLRTLFWASTKSALVSALKDANLEPVDQKVVDVPHTALMTFKTERMTSTNWGAKLRTIALPAANAGSSEEHAMTSGTSKRGWFARSIERRAMPQIALPTFAETPVEGALRRIRQLEARVERLEAQLQEARAPIITSDGPLVTPLPLLAEAPQGDLDLASCGVCGGPGPDLDLGSDGRGANQRVHYGCIFQAP